MELLIVFETLSKLPTHTESSVTVDKLEDVLEASVLQDDIFLLNFFSGVNFVLLGP